MTWDFGPLAEPGPVAWCPSAVDEARFAEEMRVAVEAKLSFVSRNREALLTAWLAETGVHPSEAVLIETTLPNGTVLVRVERRSPHE